MSLARFILARENAERSVQTSSRSVQSPPILEAGNTPAKLLTDMNEDFDAYMSYVAGEMLGEVVT